MLTTDGFASSVQEFIYTRCLVIKHVRFGRLLYQSGQNLSLTNISMTFFLATSVTVAFSYIARIYEVKTLRSQTRDRLQMGEEVRRRRCRNLGKIKKTKQRNVKIKTKTNIFVPRLMQGRLYKTAALCHC